MRYLVIGLDGAPPELLFGDERLTNLRHLMEAGCYGRLESTIPPTAAPAWMSLATSQDPGSLGIYGHRARPDYSSTGLEPVDFTAMHQSTVWDELAGHGQRSIILDGPPPYLPRRLKSACNGCPRTPDTSGAVSQPRAARYELERQVDGYPAGRWRVPVDEQARLRNEVVALAGHHFERARHLIQDHDWDFLQFVEVGGDRLQRAFWSRHDPRHRQHLLGNPDQNVIRDYYHYLDDELGSVLELLDDNTAVLVVSVAGAQCLDGGFCLNEWLIQEGLLVLEEYPARPTPFERLKVNWDQTRVWSEGGPQAQLFFNLNGREPHGAVDPAQYDQFAAELSGRLETLRDGTGQPLKVRVFKPIEIYRAARNVAPDLIVYLGDLHWSSVSSVGRRSLHIQAPDSALDDCAPAQFGSFVLAAPNSPLSGEIEGAHLFDLAPTLLELGGYPVPPSMQGRSLVAGLELTASGTGGLTPDEEEIVRERLRGLGYIE
jgi:predicted AlkP superfamily phosphohydrolase/phosphomutase